MRFMVFPFLVGSVTGARVRASRPRVVRLRDVLNVTAATLHPIYSTCRYAIVDLPVTRTLSRTVKGPAICGSPSTTEVILSASQVTTAALFAHTRGRWKEAAWRVEELLATGEAPDVVEPDLRRVAAQLRLAQDDIEGAASECERALALVRAQQHDIEAQATVRNLLLLRAGIAIAEGRPAAAQELADSMLPLSSRSDPEFVIELALLLADLDRPGDALIEEASSRPSDPWLQAAAAIVQGQLEQATDRLVVLGTPPYEAAVRLRAAARLVAEGRRAEADAQLQQALAFYRSVGATRYIREGEALLAATA
ncbi:MAG: hypothetical protein ACR2GV_05740 [Gaiellaceae bacterium]